MGTCCSNRREEFNLVGYEDQILQTSEKTLSIHSKHNSKSTHLDKTFDQSDSQSIHQQKPKAGSFSNAINWNFSKASSKDSQLLLSVLNSQFAFNTFPEEQQEMIIKKINYLNLPPRHSLCLNDKEKQLLWVIHHGKVEISDGFIKKVLVKGDIFGNFQSNKIKHASTLESTSLWIIDRHCIVSDLNKTNDYEEVTAFLNTSHLFRQLSQQQRFAMMNSLTVVKYLEGEVIVEEGQSGDLFFFIKEGSVQCKSPGKFIRYLYSGECFGELALLYNTRRTCTITAVSTVKCLVISITDLKATLGKDYSQIVYKNPIRLALEKSVLARFIKSWQYEEIVEKIELLTYKSEIVIPAETLQAAGLFIVLNGKLVSKSQEFRELSVLGDLAIVENSSEKFEEIRAVGEAEIGYISKLDLFHIISQAVEDSDLHQALSKSNLFKLFSPEKLAQIRKNLKQRNYEQDEIIFSQGSVAEDFFIVKSGVVAVYINGLFIRRIEGIDYFGERSLIFNEPRSASIRAEGKVECWVLNKSDFLQIIDQRVLSVVYKKIQAQDTEFDLNDLLVIKKLADGQLGEVLLTKCMKNNQMYALKLIDKKQVKSQEVRQNLINEKNLLLDIHHCFIPSLVKTFKDKDRLYFLMEYVQGEDLFDVIRRINLLSEKNAKFYSCCLALIIDYLHKKKIAYRDLKPENVMIDEFGYPNLIDFGAAKIIHHKTCTVIGTPYYMAPEIVQGQGYSTQVDYWSLGVMVYEFMYGVVPFGETETDSYKIFDQVVNGELVFPNSAGVKDCAKDFIRALLNKNPLDRIKDPMAHEWLKETDWDALINKKFKAPYTPAISDLTWATNKAQMLNRRISTSNELPSDEFWDADF